MVEPGRPVRSLCGLVYNAGFQYLSFLTHPGWTTVGGVPSIILDVDHLHAVDRSPYGKWPIRACPEFQFWTTPALNTGASTRKIQFAQVARAFSPATCQPSNFEIRVEFSGLSTYLMQTMLLSPHLNDLSLTCVPESGTSQSVHLSLVTIARLDSQQHMSVLSV